MAIIGGRHMIYYDEKDIHLQFETDKTVFSPSAPDVGTLSMLEYVKFNAEDKILDLGCGYGFVGIYSSNFVPQEQIYMSDISDDALKFAKRNLAINKVERIKLIKSNGLDNIEEENFTLILSNPPYHEDFSVPKNFIEKGFRKLQLGGKLYMVTKRKDWYKNKITAVFGGVRVHEINGYYVFEAEKRERKCKKVKEPKGLSKKLQRKYKKH